MTISEYQNKLDKMEKRLRLRDWLETKISDPLYPGLEWLNKQQKIFRIPWKHGGRHGWKEEEDARLFREWSEHTGASPRDVKQHKANFRCALNSLRDVRQLQTMSKRKGDDAYRVYQMLPKVSKKKNTVWIKKRKSSSPASKSEDRLLQHQFPRRMNYLNSDSSQDPLSPQLDWTVVNEKPSDLSMPSDFECPNPEGYIMGFPPYEVLDHQYNEQSYPAKPFNPFPQQYTSDFYESFPPMETADQIISPPPHVSEYTPPQSVDMSLNYEPYLHEHQEESYFGEKKQIFPDCNHDEEDSVFIRQTSPVQNFPDCYSCYGAAGPSPNDYCLSPCLSFRSGANEHGMELPVDRDYVENSGYNLIGVPQQPDLVPQAPRHRGELPTTSSQSMLPSASTLLPPLANENLAWTCQGTAA